MNNRNQKMNRLVPTVSILIILAMTIFLMTSCGQEKKGNNHAANGTTGVADLLQSAENASNSTTTSEVTTIATIPSETPETTTAPSTTSADGIDYDLSQMSSNTVYAEVLGMVYEPDRYRGKTIKMKGAFAVYHDETTDKYYFACIIQDATACCAQGIEFSLKGDYKYPEEGAEITVVGIFDTYEEGEQMYLILNDASFVS